MNDSQSIVGGLICFDEETQEYKRNVNYRPIFYAPYPFVASRISSLAPPSDLAPSSANTDTPGREQRKADSLLDLGSDLRTWQASEGSSPLRKEDGYQVEASAPALSAAYIPTSWLSEQDWFEDAPTDNTNLSSSCRSESEPASSPIKNTGNAYEGDRSACPGAESVHLTEGSCSARPGTESAPLEDREIKGRAESAYLEERIKVAEKLEAAARSASLRSMRSLGVNASFRHDVRRTDSTVQDVETFKSCSHAQMGPLSILKRSRTDELQPEASAKRVRWYDSTGEPAKTRADRSARLYSPRPPQRWEQRLAHGVARIKAAFADVVVKNQSSSAM